MKKQFVNVGVLAIQGAFAEHAHNLELAFELIRKSDDGHLADVKLQVREVRKVEHLHELDGIILPGGESTTMSKFLQKNGFLEALTSLIHSGVETAPVVWGTCAGLIMLSNNVQDMKKGGQDIIGGLDVTTSRNAYGRQFESFETSIKLLDSNLKCCGSKASSDNCPGVFIRAPQIESVDGTAVQTLATISRNDKQRVVAVRQGHVIGTSFHPELTDDYRWHTYFIKSILDSSFGTHYFSNS